VGRTPKAALFAALLAFSASFAAVSPAVRADMEDIPYVVARGDTGHRIARRFALRLPALAALNPDVDLEHLRPGQRLIVGHGFRHTHRVLPGEGLRTIAIRWEVDVRLLRAWNDLTSTEAPDAGDELIVFSDHDTPPSASVGRPSHGSLEHGIVIPPHDAWRVRTPSRAYVTHYVAEWLVDGFEAMHARHPDALRVEIRDASRAGGGRLREHRSHQSGRDIDIAYLRHRCPDGVCGHHWTRPSELDAEATWTLIHRWIERGLVEYVFVDRALQAPLYEAARAAGVRRVDLSAWFQYPRGEDVRHGIIRHVPRHADHLHVRFVCAEWDAGCLPTDGSHDEEEDGETVASASVTDSGS
jgi:LysM repeat protein